MDSGSGSLRDSCCSFLITDYSDVHETRPSDFIDVSLVHKIMKKRLVIDRFSVFRNRRAGAGEGIDT